MTEDQNPAEMVGDVETKPDNEANALPEPVERDDAATADGDSPESGAVADAEAETKPDASDGDETPPAEEEKSRSMLRRERRKQHQEETEAKLREAEAKLEAVKAAGASSEPPKEDDFGDYTEFVAAKAVWAFNSQSRAAQTDEATKQHEVVKAERDAAIQAGWNEQVEAAKSTFKDFEQVAYNSAVPITKAMAEVIQSSDMGAHLAYHLGSNLAEASKIARMSPLAAAKELGRIEANLSAPKARTATKAPAPIRPVKPNAGTGEKSPEDMSYQEFVRWRQG